MISRDLGRHSLEWEPDVWGPTVLGRRMLDLGNPSLDWEPRVWGRTILEARILDVGIHGMGWASPLLIDVQKGGRLPFVQTCFLYIF